MEVCKGESWGTLASDIRGATDCVTGCQGSLRRMLAPNNGSNRDFCEALVRLGEAGEKEMMLGLYCCDSQLCGVNNTRQGGLDPNVNSMINICQSVGITLIEDPGPPPSAFTCTHTLLPSSDTPCTRTSISTTQTSPTSTMMITGSSSIGASQPSISSIEDPKLVKSLKGDSDGGGGLSKAAKAVIATAVTVAILVALIAVFWHYRYRKKNKMAEQMGNSRSGMGMAQPQGALLGRNLVSPSASLGPDGEPLTPPRRLKERRILPNGSTERLIESQASNRRPGFHLPTSSIAGPGSVYGSMSGSSGAGTSRPSTERRRTVGASFTGGRSPGTSPVRDQFASATKRNTLASRGPPPMYELPSKPTRAAVAQGRSKSQIEVSPNAIGVALDFPHGDDDLSRQTSQNSGASSESKIMTGPLAGGWRDSVVTSDGNMPQDRSLATPASRPIKGSGRSPILEERDLEEMAGTYRPIKKRNSKY